MRESRLEGKRVLVVDDEPDVLEALRELLPMCEVVTASGYDEGKAHLEAEYFDLAILDIMGVEGFRLLEIAKARDVLAVMLTAHALSPDTTMESYRKGAAYYVPKEEMGRIATYLQDVLEAREKGRAFWWRWLERFGDFYDRKFGLDWKHKDKEFWESLKYYDRI